MHGVDIPTAREKRRARWHQREQMGTSWCATRPWPLTERCRESEVASTTAWQVLASLPYTFRFIRDMRSLSFISVSSTSMIACRTASFFLPLVTNRSIRSRLSIGIRYNNCGIFNPPSRSAAWKNAVGVSCGNRSHICMDFRTALSRPHNSDFVISIPPNTSSWYNWSNRSTLNTNILCCGCSGAFVRFSKPLLSLTKASAQFDSQPYQYPSTYTRLNSSVLQHHGYQAWRCFRSLWPPSCVYRLHGSR